MKIALLIPSLKKFGPIVFTDYLIQSIIDKVNYVEVFYFNSHDDSDVVVDFSCKTTKLNFFKKYDFSSFDIVHSTMLKPDLYVAFHKIYKTSITCSSMHNYIYKDLSMLYPKYKAVLMTKLWISTLKKLDDFIVSSNDMESYYRNLLPSKSTFEIIGYGIPKPQVEGKHKVEEFDELSQLKSKYTVLGSCGLIIKRKGFDQLLNLLADDKSLAVVLIGDGPEFDTLIEKAEKLDVSDRFKILGFKKNSISYYKFFDVFIMCSYSEGYGLAMLEALAVSLPLICSDLDIYKPVFSMPNVALFEPGNVASLKSALDFTLVNKERMSENSYKLYKNNFSLESMGDAHKNYYEKLIKLKSEK
mgnify:FL=1